MPKKEKSKKESHNKSTSQEREKKKKLSRETLYLNVTVCGDPQAIDLFTRKTSDLITSVDKYQVSIYSEAGNDDSGKVADRQSDFFLCVYDVCNCKSVDFLQQKVMKEVKSLKKPMGVAGLGLEYRRCADRDLAADGTAAALAKQYGCKGTELISCDGHQLAAGVFALYASTQPERFDTKFAEEEAEEGEEKEKKKSKRKLKKGKN